jgi:hypothetical protein
VEAIIGQLYPATLLPALSPWKFERIGGNLRAQDKEADEAHDPDQGHHPVRPPS